MVSLRQSQKETLVFGLADHHRKQHCLPGPQRPDSRILLVTTPAPPAEGTKIQDMWAEVPQSWPSGAEPELNDLQSSPPSAWPLSPASRRGWTSEWVTGHHRVLAISFRLCFYSHRWVETRLMAEGRCQKPGSSNWLLSFLSWRLSLPSLSKPVAHLRLQGCLGWALVLGGNPWFWSCAFFLAVWPLDGAHGFTDPKQR